MEILLRAKPLLEALLSEVAFEGSTLYRPSRYNYIYRHGQTPYVYNTLSRRLAAVTAEEALLLEGRPAEADAASLVRERFLVPEGTDEVRIYLQVYGVLTLYEKKCGCAKYELLPTTGCNARCFYCFEQGVKQLQMDMQTADLAADFIEKTRDPGKETELAWFGGEPLCKTDVIDRICARMEEKAIPFYSTMITNGLLWTPELAEKARNGWKLRRVQITLDGFGAEHERRKAYKGAPEKPFERTVENIGLLLDADISVSVRFNMDEENADSIEQLYGFLKERFTGRQKLTFSPALLAERWNGWESGRDARQQERIRQRWRLLRVQIARDGFSRFSALGKTLPLRYCMANSQRSLTIQPDGSLSICPAAENALCGNIRDGITERASVEAWGCNTDIREKCRRCPWLPECTGFRMCPVQPSDCRAEAEDVFLHRLKRTIADIL